MQLNQTGASTWLSAVAAVASPAASTDLPLLLSTRSPLPRRGGATAPTPAPCTPQGWGLVAIPGGRLLHSQHRSMGWERPQPRQPMAWGIMASPVCRGWAGGHAYGGTQVRSTR